MFRLFSSSTVLGGVLGRVRQSLSQASGCIGADGRSVSCSDLIGQLATLNRSGIAKVALNFLKPSPRQMDPRCHGQRLEPVDIWELVGGTNGASLMERNAELLVKLAEFARPWNEGAGIVAEQMRLDVQTLHRHLRRMHWLEFYPARRDRVPLHLQCAVSLYYVMRLRLLSLYQVSHAGLYLRLKKAL